MLIETNMLSGAFDKHGLLPAKDYVATFHRLKKSLLVQGPKKKPSDWDTEWRKQLVDNLEGLVKQLWKVGIKNVFINRIELYPHYDQTSGITDKFGNQLMFPAAFRQSKTGISPKGDSQTKEKLISGRMIYDTKRKGIQRNNPQIRTRQSCYPKTKGRAEKA